MVSFLLIAWFFCAGFLCAVGFARSILLLVCAATEVGIRTHSERRNRGPSGVFFAVISFFVTGLLACYGTSGDALPFLFGALAYTVPWARSDPE